MPVPDPRSLSFRRYILTRRYHGGRGSDKGWTFVAFALGDPDLPNASRWQELRDHLVQQGLDDEMIGAADIVWRSYLSCVSRIRRNSKDGVVQARSGTGGILISASG